MSKHIGYVVAVWLTVCGSVQAATLGFVVDNDPLTLGQTTEVSVVVSGLGEDAAPSLSAFDFNVLFDSSILSLTVVAFGDPVLGNQLALSGTSLNGSDDSVAGILNMYEVSFASVSELNTDQADSFVLGVLTFEGVGVGSSSLSLDSVVLGDALGDPLAFSLVSGALSVSDATVPVPATGFLLSTGLCLLGWLCRRSR